MMKRCHLPWLHPAIPALPTLKNLDPIQKTGTHTWQWFFKADPDHLPIAKDPKHQDSWSKLCGISLDPILDSHKNTYMIGWRLNSKKHTLDFGAYYHDEDKVAHYPEIDLNLEYMSIPLFQEATVSTVPTYLGIHFYVEWKNSKLTFFAYHNEKHHSLGTISLDKPYGMWRTIVP
jgi:hypothetical protein